MPRPSITLNLAHALVLSSAACAAPAVPPECPIAGATRVDELILPGEEHLAHLWQLTRGGENAEGYFSFEGDRIAFQRRNAAEGVECDRIYILGGEATAPVQTSSGLGVTTCAYFFPGGERLLYASTHGHTEDCPPPPDHSQGYVWPIWPEYDIWVSDLATGALEPMTDVWGYDAEATISPLGDRIVFTSTRSGDLELWTCDLDGENLVQVTDNLGYDGGAFFSHDGERLVFRSTAFTPGAEEEERAAYRDLLSSWRIRPSHMEIMLIDADGTNRRQVTDLGGANFAPFFFPDDSRVIFSTNHHAREVRNFDLFAIGVDGDDLERITTYEGFDSFPMFSPDGRYLIFASNRGGTAEGETNLFVARWR